MDSEVCVVFGAGSNTPLMIPPFVFSPEGNVTKKKVQHEIVMGMGGVGGGFHVFCLSLMTVAFFLLP